MREVELHEVCDVIAGQSPPSSTYNQDGIGVPFFQGKADFGEKFPTVRYWCTEPKKFTSPGDLLFSLRAPVGPTNFNQVEASIGRGLAAIRCREGMDVDFLRFYFLHNEDKIEALGNGSTFKAITNKTLKALKVPLPPLDEQKLIAGILDEADRVRKKTQALIDKYDELAQSLFLDMFGDPVTNPKGWEVKCLRELAEKITSGSTPKGGSDVYVDAGIPFFRCQNIWSGYFKDDELALIHLNIHNKNRNSQLRFGDILITKTGRKNTENSSLGRAAMFRGEEGNISTDVIMIRLTEEVDSEFVEFILASNLYRDYIRGKSVGGTDKRHLYVEHVGSFKIILPPREKRSDFINRLTSMRLQLQNLEMMFNCANDAFNSLLQRAFKGELT